MIYGRAGDVTKECESLTFLGEVLQWGTISMTIVCILPPLIGQPGEFELQAGCGGFEPLSREENQGFACRLQVNGYVIAFGL